MSEPKTDYRHAAVAAGWTRAQVLEMDAHVVAMGAAVGMSAGRTRQFVQVRGGTVQFEMPHARSCWVRQGTEREEIAPVPGGAYLPNRGAAVPPARRAAEPRAAKPTKVRAKTPEQVARASAKARREQVAADNRERQGGLLGGQKE